MADRLRVITFAANNRATIVLDLNDSTNYATVRDTVNFATPPRNQEWAQSSVRYEGQRLVHESHENAVFSAEWYIKGASTDAALLSMETFAQVMESVSPGRYLEWRPDGATRSIFYEIRGPIQGDLMYRWIEVAQTTPTLHIKAGFSVAPVGEGERMEILDCFDLSVANYADYVFDSGVVGDLGALPNVTVTANGTTEKRMINTARGYVYNDVQVTVPFVTGSSIPTGFKVGAILWRTDASNYSEVYVTDNGTNSILNIDSVVGGSRSNKATVTLGARLAVSSSYVIRGRVESEGATTVYASLYTGAASGAITQTATQSLTALALTSSPGSCGVVFNPQATSGGAAVKRLLVEPFVYTQVTWPAAPLMVGTIPGDLPAALSATVYTPSGYAGAKFMILAPSGYEAAAASVFGAYGVSTVTTYTTAADARYLKTPWKMSAAGTGTLSLSIGATQLARAVADEIPGAPATIAFEVFARMEVPTVAGSVVATLSAAGSTANTTLYTSEWGTGGRTLAPAVGKLRLYRLGTITLPVPDSSLFLGALGYTLTLTTVSTFASGSLGFDYFLLVPASRAAATPTSKAAASVSSPLAAGNIAVRVDHTLNGYTASIKDATGTSPDSTAGPYLALPSVGLGGALLTLPTGPGAHMLAHFDSKAPDDTTDVDTTNDDVKSVALAVKFTPQPRYFLPRGS